MKTKTKKFKSICFMLAALLIFGIGGTAYAALTRQTVELEVNSGVTVYLNDSELLSGSAGNELNAFIHEGKTYLPIRDISEAIGMEDITTVFRSKG